MALRQRFAMHLRMQHGSTMGYEIFNDETGVVVGAVSSFTPKASQRHKHPACTVYTLTYGGEPKEFSAGKEMIAAYEERKKCSSGGGGSQSSSASPATK